LLELKATKSFGWALDLATFGCPVEIKWRKIHQKNPYNYLLNLQKPNLKNIAKYYIICDF
jgi:hypothetical protein